MSKRNYYVKPPPQKKKTSQSNAYITMLTLPHHTSFFFFPCGNNLSNTTWHHIDSHTVYRFKLLIWYKQKIRKVQTVNRLKPLKVCQSNRWTLNNNLFPHSSASLCHTWDCCLLSTMSAMNRHSNQILPLYFNEFSLRSHKDVSQYTHKYKAI